MLTDHASPLPTAPFTRPWPGTWRGGYDIVTLPSRNRDGVPNIRLFLDDTPDQMLTRLAKERTQFKRALEYFQCP